MVSAESLSVIGGKPGLGLATLDAPYMVYLRACTDTYEHGRMLCEALEDRIKLVACGNGQVRGTSQRDNVAQVVDLVPRDQRGVRVGQHICVEHLRSAYRGEMAGQVFVERFLEGLRECEDDVQTRLVLLQVEESDDENKALVDLLFAHIAGVELGMRPQHVDMVAQLSAFAGEGSLLRYPVQPDLLYLGELGSDAFTCMGFHLGSRKFGSGNPSTVVLRLGSQARPDQVGPVNLVCSSSAFVKEPTVATPEAMRSQCYVHTTTIDAATYLVYNLRRQISAAPFKADEPDSGHWLAALLLQACQLHARTLDSDLIEWRRLAEKGTQQARRDAWSRMKRLQAHARAELEQAEAMQEHAGYPCKDPAQRAINLLRRLHDEIRARAEEVKISIDNEMQLTSMEVSQLSINESRSAIAVTVLAFAFVPISLASSVFGMNVQEINSTGHSIWSFITTAIAMLLVSVMAWVSWRAVRNWKQMFKAAQQDQRWGSDTSSEKFELLRQKFQANEHSTWRRRVAWLGLRAIERRGDLAFG